jgi:hypothetical protein
MKDRQLRRALICAGVIDHDTTHVRDYESAFSYMREKYNTLRADVRALEKGALEDRAIAIARIDTAERLALRLADAVNEQSRMLDALAAYLGVEFTTPPAPGMLAVKVTKERL